MRTDSPKTVADLGEFGLIARIADLLPAENPELLVGIGDDACAFRRPQGGCLLFTADAMVEGVHFRKGWGSWRQVGKKAMAAAISDIAAMGGKPLWALVTLALEPTTPVSVVEEVYAGLREVASQAGVEICGGDTVRSPSGVYLNVAVLGECVAAKPVVRGGARPGDSIVLTGLVGASRAGLALLERGEAASTIPARAREEALKAHLEPEARWREGMLLGEAGIPNSMIDVSDGLLADLERVCLASGVGARIASRAVPVADCCKAIAVALGVVRPIRQAQGRPGSPQEDALTWALEGGEDYELLFTCPPERLQHARDLIARATSTPLTVIGSITETKEIVIESYTRSTSPGGYRHF